MEAIRAGTKEDIMMKPIVAFFENGSAQAPLDIRRRLHLYSFKDGILWFQNTIFVPNIEELHRQILRSRHDSPIAGH